MPNWVFLERPLASWMACAGVFAAVIILTSLVRQVLRKRIPLVGTAPGSVGALVAGLNAGWLRWSTLVLATALAAVPVAPPPAVVSVLRGAVVIILGIQACRWVHTLIDWASRRIDDSSAPGDAERGQDERRAGTLTGLRWVVLLAGYSAILLISLQNLGVDVTALVAGLGVGGIAVALAVQNILSDLFASLTIALDRPFVPGDFIVVGTEMGTVENVGLKTTRVRSLSGEQLVFSNSDLLASRIRNFKRMRERRVVFGFGVTYGTPAELLATIPRVVHQCVAEAHGARFDRCHLCRFGPSSLDYEVVYYVESPDYNAHMDVLEAIHLGITARFRARGIEFAFPTQTLHVSPRQRDHVFPTPDGAPAPAGPTRGA